MSLAPGLLRELYASKDLHRQVLDISFKRLLQYRESACLAGEDGDPSDELDRDYDSTAALATTDSLYFPPFCISRDEAGKAIVIIPREWLEGFKLGPRFVNFALIKGCSLIESWESLMQSSMDEEEAGNILNSQNPQYRRDAEKLARAKGISMGWAFDLLRKCSFDIKEAGIHYDRNFMMLDENFPPAFCGESTPYPIGRN